LVVIFTSLHFIYHLNFCSALPLCPVLLFIYLILNFLINLFLCNRKVKMRSRTIDSFYKRKAIDIERDEEVIISSSEPEQVCENPRIGENESRPSERKFCSLNFEWSIFSLLQLKYCVQCDLYILVYFDGGHPKHFWLALPLLKPSFFFGTLQPIWASHILIALCNTIWYLTIRRVMLTTIFFFFYKNANNHLFSTLTHTFY